MTVDVFPQIKENKRVTTVVGKLKMWFAVKKRV